MQPSTLLFCLTTVVFLAQCGRTAPVEELRIEDYENFLHEIDRDDVEAVEASERNALKSPITRWPGNTLYYRISSEFTEEEANNVRQAVQVFNDCTCVRFEEYNKSQHAGKRYIYYKRSPNMCGTKVGYQTFSLGSTHDVVMSPHCLGQTGVIQHETMHVLGLFHEQSRPDRNEYVQIEYENIPRKYWPQFAAHSETYTTTYDVPYDYKSLMHYSQYAFAIDKTKPTMRAKEGDEVLDREMGQVTGPSEGDLKKINIMYKCEGQMQEI